MTAEQQPGPRYKLKREGICIHTISTRLICQNFPVFSKQLSEFVAMLVISRLFLPDLWALQVR